MDKTRRVPEALQNSLHNLLVLKKIENIDIWDTSDRRGHVVCCVQSPNTNIALLNVIETQLRQLAGTYGFGLLIDKYAYENK